MRDYRTEVKTAKEPRDLAKGPSKTILEAVSRRVDRSGELHRVDLAAGVFAIAVTSCSPGPHESFDLSGEALVTSGVPGTSEETAESTEDEGLTGLRLDLGNDAPWAPTACPEGAEIDRDGDGFREGDCNDCDPNVNPGAIEVIDTAPGPNGMVPAALDEDCDGVIDNVPTPCDADLDLASDDPMDAARALELCQVTTADDPRFGVLEARYVRANGDSAPVETNQHGLMSRFGTNVVPHVGERLLVLSSGRARTPEHDDSCGAFSCVGVGTCGVTPSGFPQDAPGCPITMSGEAIPLPECPANAMISDDIGLELTLRAPTNATGYRFDFNFFTFEYPEWICNLYNDQFIAWVDPPPEGAVEGNISFDAMLNPVSVNIAFFEVCADPQCPRGADELLGTGFDLWDDAGATSWLQTTAPVRGGEIITIRFTIWDTRDVLWDSTVVIDNFEWIATPGSTVAVETRPVG